MQYSSLRQNVFQVIVGGMIVTAMLILFNVWSAIAELTRNQINRDLSVAENVFTRALEERQQLLRVSASVLTADYGFKRAVATSDQETIQSALTNHGKRIFADFMVLTDLDGNVVTNYPKLLERDKPFPYSELIRNTDQSDVSVGFILIDEKLYQFFMLPVKAPRTIAYVGIGFEVNNSFLVQLRDIIQAEITLYLDTSNGVELLTSSLDNDAAYSALNSSEALEIEWHHLLLPMGEKYAGRNLSFDNISSDAVKVLLSEDVTPFYAGVRKLHTNLIGISIVAVVVLTFFASLVSRNVSKPLDQLVDIVRLVAKGNYNQEIKVDKKVKEISHLASAFDSMQTDIKQRESEILYQAEHDLFSGMYNRQYMREYLDAKFESEQSFQVIGINIAGYGSINDLYGYGSGDECVKNIADRLKQWGGVSARLGGGELIWVTEATFLQGNLENIKNALEFPVSYQDALVPMKVVLTELDCPSHATSTSEVFRKINILGNEVRQNQTWLLSYRDDIEDKYLRRLNVVSELRTSLKQNRHEFSLVYQPKLDLNINMIKGVEVLIRWTNKNLGFVPPDEFISLAEDAGLIDQVTLLVVQQAIVDLSLLRNQGYSISAAINLSTRDIQNENLLSQIEHMLSQANLTHKEISFEITESDIVEDAQQAIFNLNQLKNRGFSLAIDDFGTGYSSLSYLKNLPVDVIKVDKSFVLKLASDTNDQQIVKSVLELAENFNLKVVAEGVEDQDSLELLREWGCDFVQGYHLSRPLKREDLITWLGESEYSAAGLKIV